MTKPRIGFVFLGAMLLALAATVAGLYLSPRQPSSSEAARCGPVGTVHDCRKDRTTATATVTATVTATATIVRTATPTNTPCSGGCPPTNTPTNTVTPTTTLTVPPSVTPTQTHTPTPCVECPPTETPIPTETPTPCGEPCPATDTPTATATPPCFGLLSAPAPAGTSVLQITNDACVAGDYLLVAPNQQNAEVVQIATADGLTLTLVSPLTFDHPEGESYMPTTPPT